MASNASIERGGTLCSCAARFPSKPCTTRMSVSGACERRWSRVVARRRRLRGSVSMMTRGCMEDSARLFGMAGKADFVIITQCCFTHNYE